MHGFGKNSYLLHTKCYHCNHGNSGHTVPKMYNTYTYETHFLFSLTSSPLPLSQQLLNPSESRSQLSDEKIAKTLLYSFLLTPFYITQVTCNQLDNEDDTIFRYVMLLCAIHRSTHRPPKNVNDPIPQSRHVLLGESRTSGIHSDIQSRP